MNKIIYLILTCLCCLTISLSAQPIPTGELRLQGKVNEHSIQLRWAPTDAISWQLLNKYGYRLERTTTFRNGQLLDTPEKQVLLSQRKPAPQSEWEQEYLKDTTDHNLPIAAQAIYGESFYLQASSGNQLAHFVNQLQEQENRYSFALLAADQSINVARLMGLYFEDLNVHKGERYLYKLSSLAPDSLQNIPPAYKLLFADEVVELPQPFAAKAVYREGKVQVSWDWKSLEDFYNAYEIQRSDDGGRHYKNLTETPFIQPVAENASRIMLYPDTLANNDGIYYYRVRGRDAYSASGPYSEPLEVKAYPVMSYTPEIKAFENEHTGEVEIHWQVNPEEAFGVESLRLARSESDRGPYMILRGDLPVHDGSFRDIAPESSNYYKLAAVDKGGNENWSLVKFVQPMDSIPPAAPQGLIGQMDTTGVVSIQWTPNKERDLYGYRVYRANEVNDTWIQATKKEILRPAFEEELSTKVLNKKVYYKVMAVDRRGNPSDYSEVLEVQRPDLIPPSPPQIVKGESNVKGPAFYWRPSGSNDVAGYQVYRKSANQGERWEWISTLPVTNTEQYFIDSTIYDFQPYYYLMIAIDDSGLESVPSKPIGVQRFEEKIKRGITDLKGKRNNKGIFLEWKNPLQQKFQVDIYRAQDNEPIRFYKRIDGQSFLDEKIQDQKKYKYRLRLAYEGGQVSKFSEEVKL